MSKPGDPRLIDILKKTSDHVAANARKVALLGYPCDTGVVRNGGRAGAKGGPDALRKKLFVLGPVINPEFDIDLKNIHLVDRGNCCITDSLEDNHVYLTKAVKSILDDDFMGVIVGGGNDQSYCSARALMTSVQSGSIGVVNIDAHLDVRPLLDGKLAHSGSPFRQLLEDDMFKGNGKFAEFAIQGNQCSAEHADFVESKGGKLVWLSQLRKNDAIEEFKNVLVDFGEKDTFVSFDIDSIRGADCPGVSCPAVIGLSAQEALDICFAAGQHKYTKLLDLSEYNPVVEEDRTCRLVANMIYYFLMGVATRK